MSKLFFSVCKLVIANTRVYQGHGGCAATSLGCGCVRVLHAALPRSSPTPPRLSSPATTPNSLPPYDTTYPRLFVRAPWVRPGGAACVGGEGWRLAPAAFPGGKAAGVYLCYLAAFYIASTIRE